MDESVKMMKNVTCVILTVFWAKANISCLFIGIPLVEYSGKPLLEEIVAARHGSAPMLGVPNVGKHSDWWVITLVLSSWFKMIQHYIPNFG